MPTTHNHPQPYPSFSSITTIICPHHIESSPPINNHYGQSPLSASIIYRQPPSLFTTSISYYHHPPSAFWKCPCLLEITVYTKMQITMRPVLILLICLLFKETPQVSAAIIWSSSAKLSSSKPGCQGTCGNLTIRYPFGIGKRCSFNEYFELSCKNKTAFIGGRPELPVKHLSMDSISTVVNFTNTPYNKSSGKNIYDDESDNFITNEHFSLSNKNIIVAIGCDIYAYVKDLDTSSGDNILSECASFCANITNNVSSSSSYCTGSNGCCQSEFLKTPRQFSMAIQTMNTKKTSWAYTNCTYFIVVEKGISDPNFPQLLGKCKDDDYYEARVAFDWVIGNVSCDKAMRRPNNYACRENSKCVNVTTRPAGGYRCDCSPGYQGNPYLPHGCKDINECANPKER